MLRTIRRLGTLLLVAAAALSVGLGSDQEAAVSQEAGAPASYLRDHIVVKPKDEIPQSSLLQIEKLNGSRDDKELPLSDVLLADVPEGATVQEAVTLYERSPYVEYAEPDAEYSLEELSCSDTGGTDGSFAESVSPECSESALNEPPPPDPTPDPTLSASDLPSPGPGGLVPRDPYYRELYGLNNAEQTGGTYDADIDAQEAWTVTTGSPDTVVAVVDTGVDVSHADLADKIWTNGGEIPNNGVDDDGNGFNDDVNGWDFHNMGVGDPTYKGDNTVYDGAGEDAHGTNVAGIVAADGDNGLGVTGVDWQAKVMPLKVVTDNTVVQGTTIAEAVRYAVLEGADVVNLSLGCYYPEISGCYSRTLLDAIREADAAGVLVVTSAGNRGIDTDLTTHFPSGYDSPNVVSVAASRHDDTLSSASNFGATSVDLAAPGQNIWVTEPNDGYGYSGGTSLAAPYVAGVAALLKSSSPGLGHLQAKARIMSTVDKKDGLAGTSVSSGRLNAARSLGLNLSVPQISLNAASPLPLAYGAGVTLSGNLASSGQPIAGEQVVLEKRPFGASGYTPFATVTTAADGTFTDSTSHPAEHTDYRARIGGNVTAGREGAVSPSTRVNVQANVSLTVSGADLKAGRYRPIKGYVGPNHAGQKVTVTVDRRNSTWVRRIELTLGPGSGYSINFRTFTTGYFDVTTRFAGDVDHLADTSVRKGFRVVP